MTIAQSRNAPLFTWNKKKTVVVYQQQEWYLYSLYTIGTIHGGYIFSQRSVFLFCFREEKKRNDRTKLREIGQNIQQRNRRGEKTTLIRVNEKRERETFLCRSSSKWLIGRETMQPVPNFFQRKDG